MSTQLRPMCTVKICLLNSDSTQHSAKSGLLVASIDIGAMKLQEGLEAPPEEQPLQSDLVVDGEEDLSFASMFNSMQLEGVDEPAQPAQPAQPSDTKSAFSELDPVVPYGSFGQVQTACLSHTYVCLESHIRQGHWQAITAARCVASAKALTACTCC